MKTVTVLDMVVALKLLWSLTEGPTLHVSCVVLHQRLLEQNDGALVVTDVIQLHCFCE